MPNFLSFNSFGVEAGTAGDPGQDASFDIVNFLSGDLDSLSEQEKQKVLRRRLLKAQKEAYMRQEMQMLEM